MAAPVSTPLRVLLIDPSAIGRRGLHALLAEDARFRIVAEAATDGVSAARREQPALIVIDPYMGGRIDLALIAQLHQAVPKSRIAVVSDAFEARSLLAAVLAGAQAYLLKNTDDPEALRDNLAFVCHRGPLLIDPAIAEHYRGYPPGALVLRMPDPAAPELTKREDMVLQRLSAGQTREEIAAQENLSVSSVKRVIASLEAKLDVRNTSLLLLKAERLGMLLEVSEPNRSAR